MPAGTPLTRILHLLLTLFLLPLKLFASAKPSSTHHPNGASPPQNTLSNAIENREPGGKRGPLAVTSPRTQDPATRHTHRDPVDLERGLPTHTHTHTHTHTPLPASPPPHSPIPAPARPASRVSFAPSPQSKSHTVTGYCHAPSATAPRSHTDTCTKGPSALPKNDPPRGTTAARTPSCEVEWWYWPLLPPPPAAPPASPDQPTPTSPQPPPTPHASAHPAPPRASDRHANPQTTDPRSNATQPAPNVLQRNASADPRRVGFSGPGLGLAFFVPMTFAAGPLSPGSGANAGSVISGGGTSDRLFVGMVGATPRGCSATIVDPTGPTTPTGPGTTGPIALTARPAPSPSPALRNGDNDLASPSPTHQPPFHPSSPGTSHSSLTPTPPLSPLSPIPCPPNGNTLSSRPSHASFSPSFVFPTPLASRSTQKPSSKAPSEENALKNTNPASTSSHPSSTELDHDSFEFSYHDSSAFEVGGIFPSFPFRFNNSDRDGTPFDFIHSRRDTPFTFTQPPKTSVVSPTTRGVDTLHRTPTHRLSSPNLSTTSSEYHGSASSTSSVSTPPRKHPLSSTHHNHSPPSPPLSRLNANPPPQRPDTLKRDAKLRRRAYRFLESDEHPYYSPRPLPLPEPSDDDHISSETSCQAPTWRACRQSLLLPTLNLMYSPHGSFECDFGVWGGCGEVGEGVFDDLGVGGEAAMPDSPSRTAIEPGEEEDSSGRKNEASEDKRLSGRRFAGAATSAHTSSEDTSIFKQSANEPSKTPKSYGNHEAMLSSICQYSETDHEGPAEPSTRTLLHPSFSAPEARYYGFYHEWFEGLGVYEGWSGGMESEGGAVCRGLYDGAGGGFVGRGDVGFVPGEGDGDEEEEPLHSYPSRPFSLPDLICTDQVAQLICGAGRQRGEGDNRRGKDGPGGENLMGNEVGCHITQGLGDRLDPAMLSSYRSDATGSSGSGNASGKTRVRHSRLPTFLSLRRTSEFLVDVDVDLENEGVKGAGGEGVEENEGEWDENGRVGEEGVNYKYVGITAYVEGEGERCYRGYARKLDQGLNRRRFSTLSNSSTKLVPPAWMGTETSDLEETAESVTSYMSCQSFRSVV